MSPFLGSSSRTALATSSTSSGNDFGLIGSLVPTQRALSWVNEKIAIPKPPGLY
jgi:hypothetical protein